MTLLASPGDRRSSYSTESSPQTDQEDAAVSQTVVLDVAEMRCASCVGLVEKTLAQCAGVSDATVNLVTGVAAVDCAPDADIDAIAQTVTDAGFPTSPRQSEQVSRSQLNTTDWLSQQSQAQTRQIRKVFLATTTLFLSVLGHLQHFSWSADWLNIPIISTLWFHGLLATFMLLVPARKILVDGAKSAWRRSPNMNTLVSLGALSAYTTSLVSLLMPQLGWECFFDEPVMLLSFVLIGRVLEERARFSAAESLRSLVSLQPAKARLVSEPNKRSLTDTELAENALQISIEQVQVGDWLQVLPGEKIPVDGVIAVGQTTVDESMLTGESVPVAKHPDDDVIAGSLNQSGAIVICVSHTGSETTLSQLIQLVESAQTRKAPIQGLADSISGYFTYGVLSCAVLTFLFWYTLGTHLWPEAALSAMGHWHHSGIYGGMSQGGAMPTAAIPSAQSLQLLVSLKLAISVVVVACPCALGLATPTAILVGSGLGAENGLLIRGGDVLEAAHSLDMLVFDKTGTLTTGSPHLTDHYSLDSAYSPAQLLQIAATVESGTQHPVAIALQQAAVEKNLSLLSARNFQTVPGYGAAATLEFPSEVGQENEQEADRDSKQTIDRTANFFIGNSAWLAQNDCVISRKGKALASQLAADGKTVVYIANSQMAVGLFGLRDTLRPNAAATLSQLKQLGLTIRMLSGDSWDAAAAIGSHLGIARSHIQAGMTPAEKVSAISSLQADGHRLAFVGDGINDAPALAQSNVGIALNSGTEVAIEAADIVLMGDQLSDVLNVLRLSRATFNKIRQNLAWAFAYNIVCIPLASGVFLPKFNLALNPGFAGGLMALSSITVVVNALLLRKQRL